MEEVDIRPGPSGEVLLGINPRRAYALAPCHHIFHTKCLAQWLAIKVSLFVDQKAQTLNSEFRPSVHFVRGVYRHSEHHNVLSSDVVIISASCMLNSTT